MDYNGHIIVTGGGKGIGRFITETLLEANYRVSVLGRSEVNFENYKNDQVSFFKCDVSDTSLIPQVLSRCIEWGGEITGLVNNAGASEWKPLAAITEDFWNEMMCVNAKSCLFVTQAVFALAKNLKSIVNISSLAGKRGSANNSVYCASKFAVNGITQSLAKELGVQNIRVNALCPVYVKTEGVIVALNDEVSPRGNLELEEYFSNFAQSQSALKRLPLGEEVAKACKFLLSDESSAITGQCINIDCGVLPQ